MQPQSLRTVFIEELGQHLGVSSIPELSKSLKLDRGFWNVLSIREPCLPRPDFLAYARHYHEVLCEDREHVDPNTPCRPPRSEDVEGIIQFVDAHAGEPLMLHCFAGLSRSTAVALALIVRGLTRNGWSVNDAKLPSRAVALLLQIRPKARPNSLFLHLFLQKFLPADDAEKLTSALIAHPVLVENRSPR